MRPPPAVRPRAWLLETLCLAAIAAVAVGSLVLSLVARRYFETVFTDEEHFVENLTAVVLAGSGALCAVRAFTLRRDRPRGFLAVTLLLAFMYLAAAGEEISWGQRILGVRTPDFLAARNAQREINVHNLVVGNVQVKRVMEGVGPVVLILYLLVLPVAHAWRPRDRPSRVGLPVPRVRHAAVWLLATIVTKLIPSVRGPEVTECVIVMAAFVATAFPANHEAFRRR